MRLAHARWIVLVGATMVVGAIAPRASAQPSTLDIGRQYAHTLQMLGEPDLQRVSEERETFRMLWLRSFHEPVAVRVVRDGNRYIVITAQAVRRPDGSFGPTRRDSLSLDAAAWKRVVELAEIRQFWSLRAPDTLGLDGARWIIEGRRGQRYHAVDWWSPDDRDGPDRPAAFRGLALDILDQGTVCVKPSAVY